MFKDLSVTLYDLFGYLFPGLFALLALSIGHWAFFYPSYVAVLYGYEAVMVTAVLGLAYVVGHVIQAVASQLEEKLRPEDQPRADFASHIAFPAIEKRLIAALSIAARKKDKDGEQGGQPDNQQKADKEKNKIAKDYQDICDHANAGAGITGERDIFIHRKGFYRGVTLGMTMLAASLLIAAWNAPLEVQIRQGVRLPLYWGACLLWATLSAVGAGLCWQRYKLFCKYHVEEAFLTFAALQFLATEKDGSTTKPAEKKSK